MVSAALLRVPETLYDPAPAVAGKVMVTMPLSAGFVTLAAPV